MRRLIAGVALLWATSLAGAAPAMVKLTAIPRGTQWIAWNESGVYQLGLPSGWTFRSDTETRVRLRLAEGQALELPPRTQIQTAASALPRIRAGYLRGEHTSRGLQVTIHTQRLDFPGGAPFIGDFPGFPAGHEALVSTIELSQSVPLELDFPTRLRSNFQRVQFQVAGTAGADTEAFQMPGVADKDEPARVTSFGLWSADGLQFEATEHELVVMTEKVGWCEINSQHPRAEAVRLTAPRAELWVRQETFKPRCRLSLPCKLTEPSGLIAEGLKIAATGAPGIVGFTAADSADGLSRTLDELDKTRAGAGHPGDDRLVATLREYLLPLWYGLWYDAVNAREEPRETPSLTAFAAAYAQAVAAARPRLSAWLQGQTAKYGTISLAQPKDLAAMLAEGVDQLSLDDRRNAAWWSIYLSDLLTDIAGAPVFYWRPGGLVSGSCAHSDQVTISALAQRAAENRVTGVGWYLNHAAASQQGLSEVSIERLGAGAEVPLTLVLDVGRRTPPGTYHVELALAGDSSERIPLTVHVLPSFGLMALLGLVTSIPFALGWALVAGFLRRGGRPKRGDHA